MEKSNKESPMNPSYLAYVISRTLCGFITESNYILPIHFKKCIQQSLMRIKEENSLLNENIQIEPGVEEFTDAFRIALKGNYWCDVYSKHIDDMLKGVPTTIKPEQLQSLFRFLRKLRDGLLEQAKQNK